MHNFEFQNPVKVLFGKGQIANIKNLLPENAKVLIAYGGGSIKKNGVFEQVTQALSGVTYFEFGGIEANPDFDTLMQAVMLCRAENINFILAVGGGSVVDGVKLISAAINFPLTDPWLIFKGHSDEITNAVPFGAILTLPATGSEMNAGSVISRRALGEKVVFRHDSVFPKFSVLDPEVTYSLPTRQLANGIVDPFIHVTEQYLTTNLSSAIQDGFAEVILRTLIAVAPTIMSGTRDYDARANWMWACTNALNGFIGLGVDHDWATHMIGHELTAAYELDHAQTLAVIAPQLWRYKSSTKRSKLLKFAANVWNIKVVAGDNISEESAIANAIIRTEDFFKNVLHVKTKLSEYNIEVNEDVAQGVANNVARHGMVPIGEHKDIDIVDITRIVLMAK